jgi:hypothetical protein
VWNALEARTDVNPAKRRSNELYDVPLAQVIHDNGYRGSLKDADKTYEQQRSRM